MNEKRVDSEFETYKVNVASADRLDERRDAAVKHYGATCIALAIAAVGVFERGQPLLATVLSAMLIAVAVAWWLTLDSLTAKLTAKKTALRQMESAGKVYPFLTREREAWKGLKKRSLKGAMRIGPLVFLLVGACLLTVSALRTSSGLAGC